MAIFLVADFFCVCGAVLKQKGMSGLVDLEIIPAGNAALKVDTEGKTVMTCQHGEEECMVRVLYVGLCMRGYVSVAKRIAWCERVFAWYSFSFFNVRFRIYVSTWQRGRVL
jgi:hypothetical protein